MGKQYLQIKNESKKDILFVFFFALMVVFNIKVASAGSAEVTLDEALYLAIPYRLLQGDSLLLHEWNMAQMASFLLSPVLKVYLTAVKSTEGIVLAFRYIYVFFHSIVALYIFLRLRKQMFYSAMAASLFYMAYCYGEIPALSYNTMGIGLMVVVCVSLAVCKGHPAEMFAIGLCFAGAVLCCPFLVIVYAVYSLSVLFFKTRKTLPAGMENAFALKSWVMFTAACVFLAIAFFVPLLASGEAGKLFHTLPEIVIDSEHPAQTPLEWLKGFLLAFYKSNAWFKELAVAGTVLTAAIFLDRGRYSRGPLYALAAVVITVFFSLPYLLMYRTTNYLIFPISILGFFSFLLTEKKNVNFFVLVFVPGMLFWICRDLSSNMGFSSISAASAVNMVAGMVFI